MINLFSPLSTPLTYTQLYIYTVCTVHIKQVHSFELQMFLLNILVAPLAIFITVPNTQTVSQSITMQCEVTTVRGITSRVDIVWISCGVELQSMNDVSSTTISNSLVYTDYYTILQLNTTDDDRVIQCKGVINANPPVMANDIIILDVIGELYL